ncbi:sulfotransferase family protein [Shimia thalassica]|uniref:sulfotransferase family protein n=1 Tax=Shimia thalassica TaxID=1715693 RepID=UPI0034E46CFC
MNDLHYLTIIGAMKAGTTTLYDLLCQHPQICRGRRKEPNFFGNDKSWNRERKFYNRLWPDFDQEKHKWALEASTAYTKSHTSKVAKRMSLYGNRFKFVYILRNPIDRIRSNFDYNAIKSLQTNVSLPHKIRTSKYASQLDAFCEYHDVADILLVDFEQLVADQTKVAHDICRFLSLDHFDFQVVGNRNDTELQSNVKKLKFSASEYAYLKQELAPDMKKLHDKYGVNVANWGFDLR